MSPLRTRYPSALSLPSFFRAVSLSRSALSLWVSSSGLAVVIDFASSSTMWLRSLAASALRFAVLTCCWIAWRKATIGSAGGGGGVCVAAALVVGAGVGGAAVCEAAGGEVGADEGPAAVGAVGTIQCSARLCG